MIKHLLYRYTMVNLSVLLLVLVGCASSPPTRFYTLNSMAASDATQQNTSENREMAIGIGPIEISDYLDRPQIVTGVGANEFKISEFDRWAGNIRNNISTVLAENMGGLLLTDEVYVYPWKQSAHINYRIEATVIRFHGMSDNNVMMKTHWTILGEDAKKPLLFRLSNYSEQIEGQGYDALIAAHNRVLANLSRDIAAALKTFVQK
jgi:uncharacterized lipoprotein YmbA